MKKLIKMYNEKYGNTLGVIDDDFNKEQMYRIYYFIKNNCDDEEIQARLEKIKLDKPKTLEQQLTKLEGEHNKSSQVVDPTIKNDINDIKSDLGSSELTTNAKDVKGAINEVNAQYKDIVNNNLPLSIKDFGAKGDSITDDTLAFKNAISSCKELGKALYIPQGAYVITETLNIDFRNFKIFGDSSDKNILLNNEHGGKISSSLVYKGNETLFKLGDASTEAYQGIQGFTIKDIYLINESQLTLDLDNPTAKAYGRGKYGANSICIEDFEGGCSLLENVTIENFEVGYYGRRADISEFYRLKINYCKNGVVADNLPQTIFRDGYFIGNDTVFEIKSSTVDLNVYNSRFVKNGSSNNSTINIFGYCKNINFNNCWFEDHNNDNINNCFIDISKESTKLNNNININNCTIIANSTNYFMIIAQANSVIIDNPVFELKPKLKFLKFVNGSYRSVILKLYNNKYDSIESIYEVEKGANPEIYIYIMDKLISKNTHIEGYISEKQIINDTPKTIVFNKTIDNLNEYNDGFFKASEDGFYIFYCYLTCNLQNTIELAMSKDGSTYPYYYVDINDTKVCGSITLYLTKGHTVNFVCKSKEGNTIVAGVNDSKLVITRLIQ